MNKDEALRLALEALDKIAYVTAMDYEYQRWAREAITAIKAELEAKDEPVAWRTFDGEGGYDYRSYENNEDYADKWNKQNPKHKGWVEPLYTTPPQRTEQEPVAIYRSGQTKGEVYHVQFLKEMAADEVLLYAAPVQRTWVGLTDEEQQQAYEQWQNEGWGVFYRAIEAKLKKKNL